jgi:hypothetical protein
MEHDPSLPFRTAELMGTPDQINRAEQLIHDVIAEVRFMFSIHSSCCSLELLYVEHVMYTLVL